MLKRIPMLVLALFLGATSIFAQSVQIETGLYCPIGQAPSGGWPVVFLLNGNAMGAVSGGDRAQELGTSVISSGRACYRILTHPAMTGSTVYNTYIVSKIRSVATGTSAKTGVINPRRFGMAGFSAGGIITNTVAYRNANDPAYSIRAAVGYYGSDLKELMRFHSLRAAHDGSLSSDLFFSSEKLWSDTCTKSTGVQLLCGDFSSQIYNTISSNMGGVTDTKLSFFSPLAASVSGIAAAPILFAGGTLDDNVISTGSSNVLSQAGVNANQTVELTYADARHGAPWTKWPASLSWLLDRL